jgi:hypothetical protein
MIEQIFFDALVPIPEGISIGNTSEPGLYSFGLSLNRSPNAMSILVASAVTVRYTSLYFATYNIRKEFLPVKKKLIN